MTVGYVFDLDETLVTYDPGVPGIFEAACARAGVEPTERAQKAIGPGYVETFRTFEESPYIGAARAAREAGLDVDPETLQTITSSPNWRHRTFRLELANSSRRCRPSGS